MSDQEQAECLFRSYVKAITSLLNVMGIEDTVALLRNSATQLEENREMLERAKAGAPRAQGVA